MKGMIKRVLLLLALMLAFPLAAHAAKVPVFFGTGDEMFVVGDFPKEFVDKYQPEAGMKLGYKCQHFSLFWADVWTWDCKQVGVVSENSYATLPAESLSMLSGKEYSMSEAKRGFWNHYAFPTALALIAGLIAFGMFSKDDEEEAEPASQAAE